MRPSTSTSSVIRTGALNLRRLGPRNNRPFFEQHAPGPKSETVAHSHSIIISHHNALISKRKFPWLIANSRKVIRQKFSLLILKGNFHDSESARFRPLPASIGRFFEIPSENGVILGGENTVRLGGNNLDLARISRRGPCCDVKKSNSFARDRSNHFQPLLSIMQSCPASCLRAPKVHWQAASRFLAAGVAF
jgi:hypothetical protein